VAIFIGQHKRKIYFIYWSFDTKSQGLGYQLIEVNVATGGSTVKARNALRDPRVALSIIGFHNPYDEAMIRGRVVERRPDTDFATMDEISRKYTGKPFPWRAPQGRIVLVIEAEHVKARKLPFDPPA
jgi:hypothetical protein